MSPQDRKQPQGLTRNGSAKATGTTHRDNRQARVSRHPVPPLNGSLPRDYGETRIVLLPVDPYVVHAYWEISAGEMGYVEALVEEGALRPQALLRFHDVTALSAGGVRTAGSFDVEIDIESRNWYVRLLSPERSYVVDLGFPEKEGRFHRIARSNRVETPRAWPCSETGRQRMRVVEVDGVTHVDPVKEAAAVREAGVTLEETGDRPGIRARVPREARRAVIGLADDAASTAPEAHEVRETRPVCRSIESLVKQDLGETRTGSGVGKRQRIRPVEGPAESQHGRPPAMPDVRPVDASEQAGAKLAAIHGRRNQSPSSERGGRLERPPPECGGRQEAAEFDLSLLCERLYVSGLPSSRIADAGERDESNDR